MLKPADPRSGAGAERPVGELVHQLIDDGKAYAHAEIAWAKAVATAKAKGFALPAGLLFGALLFLQAAVTVLAVATFLALLPPVGPFLAGLLAFLIFAGIAGGLASFALGKLKGGE